MQPYLSGYYDATRYVMKNRLKVDVIKEPTVYLEMDRKKDNAEKIRQPELQFTPEEEEDIKRFAHLL
jgi:hypothetical protein